MIKNTNTSNEDRRPSTRKPVLLTGIVAFDGGLRSFDCTIRDLSDTGARIVAAKGASIPEAFYLINVRDRMAYEAVLVRNDPGGAGIQFKKTLPLSGVTDPALGFLKKLWLSRAAG
jgi:hypothetical protein